MIPIPKAALDLAITVIAAITSEVIEAKKRPGRQRRRQA